VGVIVGLFEFWYTTEYLPANVDPGVNVFVELAAGAVPDDKLLPEYVTATITLENVSDTRVLVVGSQYYLSALSMPLEIPPSAQEGADPITGTFFDDENWFTPGQKFVAKVVMPVPDPAPPILRFDTALHVARASRLRLGRRVPFGWEIQESSLVNRITRECRYLIQDRRGRLRTCISAQQNPECPGENRRLDEVYGRMVFETVLEKAATGRAAP
jgi:hypothetical protein